MGDETRFLTEFQQRFKDGFTSKRHSRLETSEDMECRELLKKCFRKKKKKNLDVTHNQQIRITFTSFRLGISQIRSPLCNGEKVHLLAPCG